MNLLLTETKTKVVIFVRKSKSNDSCSSFVYLDSEQRLHAAKVIKRFVLNAKKTAFIVEHDFIMATYMADRVMQRAHEITVHAHFIKKFVRIDKKNKSGQFV